MTGNMKNSTNLLKFCLCTAMSILVSLPAAAQEVPKRKTTTDTEASTSNTSDSTVKKTAKKTTKKLVLNMKQTLKILPGEETLLINLPVGTSKAISFKSPPSHIRIGNENVADIKQIVGTNRFVIEAENIGSTNVLFFDKIGNIIRQASVNVVVNYIGAQNAIKMLLPDETISISGQRNTIFLTGKVRSATSSRMAEQVAARYVLNPSNVTNLLTVIGSQQVILKVKIAEMSREVTKGLAANGSLDFGLWGNPLSIVNAASSIASNTATATFAPAFNWLSETAFEAMETQSMAKTLAEPNLTALSGQSASFISGGEIPTVSGFDENGQPSVVFKPYGISLSFTPTIISEGRINLNIATEISALDSANAQTIASGVTIDALTLHRTDTTVDLPSGGSLMISGLIKDDASNSVEGVPGLKDIPILGALFRSSNFEKNESELVILVSAYLASPIDDQNKLSLPTDGFEASSDIDIYLLGRLQRQYGKGERTLWDDPFKGPFGYMMR